MARPRKIRQLPANLIERDGEYYYGHGRKTYYVGTNRSKAAAEAIEANLHLGLCPASEDHAAIESPDLLTAKAITAGAARLRDSCGVYFLLHEARIVYVGQSTNCHARISQHVSAGDKRFDSYYVSECDPASLDRLEALYIAKFRPAFNSQLGKRRGWDAAKEAHRERWAPKYAPIFPKVSPTLVDD